MHEQIFEAIMYQYTYMYRPNEKKRFKGGLKQRFLLVQKHSKHADISVCKFHFVVMHIYTDDTKAVKFYFKFEMLMVPLCWFVIYQ